MRRLRQSLCALTAALLVTASSSAFGAGIRMSWQDFASDPARVASLRKAVAAMKALNTVAPTSVDYRRSWEYWANIHGYFGPDSPFGSIADNMSGVPASDRHFFDGVREMSAPDQTARDVWAQCEHGTPFFFAWHRLYLLFFEKQLQAAAGDPNLRLPYWDYTDPAQLKMPAEFTQPTYSDASGAQKPNPLFEPRRAPGWRSNAVTLNANATNIDTFLNTATAFAAFQTGIESNVHGYVHCSISTRCPVVDMGAVPYSSNDPIFWLHHANIDRMWSCWSSIPGRTNPSDAAFLAQSYTFVDVSGAEVSKTVGALFDGSLVDYSYEKQSACARVNAPALVATAAVQPANAAHGSLVTMAQAITKPTEPIRLNGAVTKVNLELRNTAETRALSQRALGPGAAASARTNLVLDGITFASPPGAQIYVYLEDPANPERREYAGTISFFGAALAGAHSGHRHGAGMNASEGLNREFDVTKALRDLGVAQPGKDTVTVSFEATNGRVGSSEPEQIQEGADLTVRSMEFRVAPAQ